MGTVNLKLDWCTHAAAKMACERWHYSRTMPVMKTTTIGVWEDDVFVGVVIFTMGSGGACDGRRYGLKPLFEMAELQRVAMQSHQTPVSRVLALAFKFLRKACPGIRLIVSFADPSKGHHGGIYQAGGWVFVGETSKDKEVELTNGKWVHSRTVNSRGGVFGAARYMMTGKKRATPGKYRYLMPLDAEMRARIEPLRKPYPKRAGSADSGTTGIQPVGGGAVPTPALIP